MASFARYLYSIRVEGIGDATMTTSNLLYRWSWGVNLLDDPTVSYASQSYKTALLRWPRELEFSFDPRRGESSFGSMTFELRRTADVLANFYQAIPAPITNLANNITAAATSIDLDDTGLSGTVYLEREAIKLGSESGSGPYTYGATRGVLGTQAVAHNATDEDDTEVFSEIHPATLAGRLVELVRTPLDTTTEVDEEVVTRGVLRRIYSSGGGRLTLEVDHAIALIKSSRIYRNPWRNQSSSADTLRDLPDSYYVSGGGRQDVLVVREDDNHPAIAGVSSLSINGDTVFDFRGAVSVHGSPFMSIPLPDTSENPTFREFLSTNSAAPTNAAAASTNTLPLRQNPGECILQLLLSTDNGGTPGDNDSTYDTGVALIAGAIPAPLVDIAGIEAWGARQPEMDSLHLGEDSADPINLFEWITERILKPLGSAFVQTSGGKIGIASIADVQVYGTTNTISQSQVLSVDDLEMDRRLEDPVDQVAVSFNNRPWVGPDRLNATDVIKYRRQPRGEHARLELDAGAWTDRETATIIAQDFIARYHDPIAEWSFSCLRTADFWPGDVVSITHDKILAAGAQGVTSALCLVVARREVLDDSGWSIGLRVWYVGEIYDATGLIAPSAEVVSWDGATNTITVKANEYTSTDGPAFTDDASGFAVNDVVQLVDQFGAVRDASATVTAVSGNDITVSGMGVTPVAGDVVRVATYASAISTQQTAWAFIADANNLLDGTDDAKEYVTA